MRTARQSPPGFIDCHTHYDAQVFWDPMLSPSVYHGVTTVLAGNCGFTLAPLSGRKEDSDYLLAMLSRVEGMPLASLEAAVKPDWTSFGEYLDTIDGTLAINTAFLVGHSALRRAVMGERSVGEQASAEELAAMQGLLRQSLEAGGCGFSTTVSPTHSDHNGDPVPSRWASDEETVALAGTLRDYPGTWLELIPPYDPERPERRLDLPVNMSLAAQRPLNWNLIVVRSQQREMLDAQLAMGPAAAARGAKVYGLVPAAPIKAIVNFRTGQLLEMLGGWHDFIHQSDESKIAAMKDPEVRRRARGGHGGTAMPIPACRANSTISWSNMSPPERTAAGSASAGARSPRPRGKGWFDAMFDLAVEEDLWLSISARRTGRRRGELGAARRCLARSHMR